MWNWRRRTVQLKCIKLNANWKTQTVEDINVNTKPKNDKEKDDKSVKTVDVESWIKRQLETFISP
jgi:hypothetical protein